MNRWPHLIGFGLCVGAWVAVTELNLINPLFVPRLTTVLSAVPDQGLVLFHHLGATGARVATAFLLATLIGGSLGLLFGHLTRLYRTMEAVIDCFRSTPGFALYPLFLLLFGLGEAAKIGIATWVASLTILMNTIYGVRACRPGRILAARMLKPSTSTLLVKIILPEALPTIVSGLRIALSQAFVVVIGTEMFLGTKTGLGTYIYNQSLVYNTGPMYLGILVAAMAGYSLNRLFVALEERTIHWRGY